MTRSKRSFFVTGIVSENDIGLFKLNKRNQERAQVCAPLKLQKFYKYGKRHYR